MKGIMLKSLLIAIALSFSMTFILPHASADNLTITLNSVKWVEKVVFSSGPKTQPAYFERLQIAGKKHSLSPKGIDPILYKIEMKSNPTSRIQSASNRIMDFCKDAALKVQNSANKFDLLLDLQGGEQDDVDHYFIDLESSPINVKCRVIGQ